MGDGQHGWAAAEWVMMIRNLFVREEEDRMIIGQGLFPEWIETGQDMFFGPTLTPFGSISVRFFHEDDGLKLSLKAAWHGKKPEIQVAAPGYQPFRLTDVERIYRLKKQEP